MPNDVLKNSAHRLEPRAGVRVHVESEAARVQPAKKTGVERVDLPGSIVMK
jgi:hypothetical protein